MMIDTLMCVHSSVCSFVGLSAHTGAVPAAPRMCGAVLRVLVVVVVMVVVVGRALFVRWLVSCQTAICVEAVF